MKTVVTIRYALAEPYYSPDERAKLDAAEVQVFGYVLRDGPPSSSAGCWGYMGAGSGEEGQRHNAALDAKFASVFWLAGVEQRNCEEEVHTVEVELPDPPSELHRIRGMHLSYGEQRQQFHTN
jgi:hypothetical protein